MRIRCKTGTVNKKKGLRIEIHEQMRSVRAGGIQNVQEMLSDFKNEMNESFELLN
jgi:hypothetical protein